MDSISSIFKSFLLLTLFLSVVGGLSSCSLRRKKNETKKSEYRAEKTLWDPLVFGPTKKSETPFVDKTKEYGLMGIEGVAFYAVDLNGDYISDLVVLPRYFSAPQFYLFDKRGKKFQKWDHDPFKIPVKASFLLFYDFNNDGVMDVLLSVLNQKTEASPLPLTLYKGRLLKGKLHFDVDESFVTLAPEPTSTVAVLDFNLDGRLDLFVGNWFDQYKGQMIPVGDRLLMNTPKGFTDVSQLLEGEQNKGENDLYPIKARPTYGSSTCDIDHNGYPDILTATSGGYGNKLWMNLDLPTTTDRRFDEIGMQTQYAADAKGLMVPTGGGRTFFSACTDYNNDGLMDLFMGELFHAYDNDSVDRSSILTGSRSTYPPYFLRTEYLSDVEEEGWNQGDKRAVWVDLNGDGLEDLIVDNSGFPPHSRLVVFRQTSDHAFENVAKDWGVNIVNPTGTIVLDLNQDGRPDIITGQSNIRRSDVPVRVYVFENQFEREGARFVKFYLEGKTANSQGIGSMVMLYTEKNKIKKVRHHWYELTQGGLPSQHQEGITFALDKGEKLYGVKVRWPAIRPNIYRGRNVIEKLYLLKNPKKAIEVYTLCEDGSKRNNRFKCKQ